MSPQSAASDDDISVTSTAMSEMQDEYILERILAERNATDGSRQWLVKWEGYPEERSTWEPRSSFTSGEPLFEWQAKQMRIARGYDKPYDVATFEQRIGEIEKARVIHKARRRAKRIRLGLPVSTDSDEGDSSDEAEESDDEVLLDRPSVSRRGSLRTVNQSLNDFVIEKDEVVREGSPRKAKNNKISKISTSDSETGDHLSDDSLVEDLRTKEFNKNHKRLKKKLKLRGESATARSPDPPLEQLPPVGIPSIQSPLSRPVPPVGAQRRRSPPPRRAPAVETERRESQPSKKILPAGMDRRQSIPTLPPAKYSGTMNRMPSQLKGAVGTGPKRYATKQPRYQGKPKVQGAAIMGRWDASVKPRKRTMVAPGIVPTSSAKRFGKLSIQRKYEKAGRNEPAPNPENLVFINPKKDRAIPQPIATPKRNKSPVMSAWEIYRERLKNENSDLRNVEKTSVPEPEVDEDENLPMDIDWGGSLDVTPAAPQPTSVTASKQLVETSCSIQQSPTTDRQLQDVPLEPHASETSAGLLSEERPNSVNVISSKSSLSSHAGYPGDLFVQDGHENRQDNNESLSRLGPKPEVSVLTGPRSTQDPGLDPDARPLLAIVRVGHEGHKVGSVRIKGLEWCYKSMLLRTKIEGQMQIWCKVCCTAMDYRRYHHEVGPYL